MRLPALALAQRALLLDARAFAPYILRGLLVVLMLLALWWGYEMSRFMGAPGLNLFGWLVFTNFWFITLFGISSFSAVIAEEKENMTLGLLKMAGFGGPSILIGKSIGQLLTMVLLLLVQLPFALLAITLGGVSQHQIVAAYVALFAHALFVYGVAMLCSVVASRTGLAARMTALLLFVYYTLPWLLIRVLRSSTVPGGSQSAGAGDDLLVAWSEWVAGNSAWATLGSTMRTGFDAPVFDTPVLVTLGMAAGLSVLGALAFGPCTRNEVAAAPGRGFFGDVLARRNNRAISRPVGHPLFWKDFQFLSGGRTGMVLRFVMYGLLLVVMYGIMPRGTGAGSRQLGGMTMGIMCVACLLELGIQASRVFREEITWRTLSTLMILPMPMSNWAYAKLGGCLMIALPSLVYFVLGAAMAPSEFGDVVEGMLTHSFGWYFVAMVVFGLHLTVYLSLRLRRGAFAVAILLMFVGNVIVGMMMAAMGMRGNGVEPCMGILAFAVCIAMFAMHPAIGRLVVQKAAE